MSIGFKNLSEFNREIEIFGDEKVPGDHLILQKRIALDLLRRIVFRTPVDTGRARGNWQAELGGAGASSVVRKDKEGNNTVAAESITIANTQPYGIITIFNNVNYIKFLEGGSSKVQAPQGMVRVSVAEVEAQFN